MAIVMELSSLVYDGIEIGDLISEAIYDLDALVDTTIDTESVIILDN